MDALGAGGNDWILPDGYVAVSCHCCEVGNDVIDGCCSDDIKESADAPRSSAGSDDLLPATSAPAPGASGSAA